MENNTICIADFFLSQDKEPAKKLGEGSFTMKLGGTTYEVSTHYNDAGTQSVLEQFKKLLLSEHLI